jgi:dTDP-4-dehydrorhamnose reductase
MFTPVLVDQLIESVESLIERNQTGVFNIASSQVVSKFEFIKMLAIAFGLHSDMVTPGLVAASRGSIVRPQYMGLNADKLERTLGTTLELSDGMSRLVDTSERSLILRRAVS